MPQLSYSIDTAAVAYPGQPVDIAHKEDVISAIAVAAAMPYGLLGVLDASNSSGYVQAVKVPAAASDITGAGKALGIVLADQARAQDPSVAAAVYPIQKAIPLMRTGRVWVLVEQAVVAGDPVFVRFAATVNGTVLGGFRKDADTISTVDAAAQLAGGVFRSQAGIGEYAMLQVEIL